MHSDIQIQKALLKIFKVLILVDFIISKFDNLEVAKPLVTAGERIY